MAECDATSCKWYSKPTCALAWEITVCQDTSYRRNCFQFNICLVWGPWEKKRLQPTVLASLAHQNSQVIDSSQDHEPYRDIAQLLAIGLETFVDRQNPTPVEFLQTKNTHTDESSTCLSGIVRERERLSRRPLLTQQGNFNIVLRSPTCSSSKESSKFRRKWFEKSSKIGRFGIGRLAKFDGNDSKGKVQSCSETRKYNSLSTVEPFILQVRDSSVPESYHYDIRSVFVGWRLLSHTPTPCL